jgi:hypothetical protein
LEGLRKENFQLEGIRGFSFNSRRRSQILSFILFFIYIYIYIYFLGTLKETSNREKKLEMGGKKPTTFQEREEVFAAYNRN